jgi:hypothetical protein
LREIIKRRDRRAMVQIIADNIAYGRPDLASDREGFIGKDFDPKFWTDLEDILSRRCTLRDGRAGSPSLDYQLGGLDSLTTLVARPGAVLRSRPNGRARIIGRLNWHVLLDPEVTRHDDWIKVRLTDGRRGYILMGMGTGSGERVSFQKVDGVWKLRAWVNGD